MGRWKRRLLITVAALANLFILTGVLIALTQEEPYQPPDPPYYVSLGDSYAQGFQSDGDLSHGFADQVVDGAEGRGYDFGLVNFGCGGATTASMLEFAGCPFPARDGPPYGGKTQVEAAEEFLRAHQGQVELITVSIGGNDLFLCAGAPDPVACSAEVIAEIGPKVEEIVSRLRAAAGVDVPIVGTSYVNTLLGRWVYPPNGADLAVALASPVMYRDVFNPVLRNAYQAAGATFVDVTRATGGYGPLEATTVLAPYGTIPTSVARVCELTNYCQHGDIHPNTAGYTLIAELVLATLPERK